MSRIAINRAYLVLVGISALLSGLAILFCIHLVQSSNKQFCTVLNVRILEPAVKPVNPNDQEAALSYKRHKAYITLSRDLGCVK